MAVANTLAYYVTATITAVKSFIVQAPGGCMGPRYVLLFIFIENQEIARNSTTTEARERE